jgi:hypothetical protein
MLLCNRAHNLRGETKMETKYKVTKDCFVGKVGETILVDWDAYDCAMWKNIDTGRYGGPFLEIECVKEVN